MNQKPTFEETFGITLEEAGIDNELLAELVRYAETHYTQEEVRAIKERITNLPDGFMESMLRVGQAEDNLNQES